MLGREGSRGDTLGTLCPLDLSGIRCLSGKEEDPREQELCPELRPMFLGRRPLAGLSCGPQLCPPGFLLSREVLTWEGLPPGHGLPLHPPRPLPISHPHPSPTAPTQAASSPTANSPNTPSLSHPQTGLPSPPHSFPLPGTPRTRQPLRLLRAASAPLFTPTCPSHGNPSKALPLHCIPVQMCADPCRGHECDEPPGLPWVRPWPTGNVPA